MAEKQAAFDDLAKMYLSIYLPTTPYVLRRVKLIAFEALEKLVGIVC